MTEVNVLVSGNVNKRPSAYVHEYLLDLFLSMMLSSRRYSDSQRAGQSGDRIPIGARFFAPVQTGSDPHPASYTMGTRSFLGSEVSHPPHLVTRVKKKNSYISTPPLGYNGLF